ncbi:L,D-transpeptidase [Nitratifractor salsuginis]|uniref:ErfK/YbiS/YcfS/YnhG family protein n=1 Tax=Nitratifractor salsuginis (strain DSM 16511 / JCM 12458 / E9I37-1) TaxID=749222 RepID=E6WYB7_NITSE|nr:L,D-transpeptidase family protein [Nitratifractor salsuginis]ADV45365.1 ErfK/YbiS/YcfS/YnhG family protein [Nitratifractor salsuginis DSM 16511]
MRRILMGWMVVMTVFLFGANDGTRVIPLGKTRFKVIDKAGKEKIVDLRGKDFIVISLREKGADGAAYAVDGDGVVWWAASISSGAKGHETPSGIFPVLRKERYHMSKQHPDPKGVNNMDFSLFFTNRGHALHMGNTNAMSHGCIHVGEKGASAMFKWATPVTKVVVTREHYLPYVYHDLGKAGYRVTKKTPQYIRNYLKTMKPVAPSVEDQIPVPAKKEDNRSKKHSGDMF